MKKYLRLIKNELAHIFYHDLRRGVLLLGAAPAYLLLFAWLYAFGIVNQIPLLVVDQDNTYLSRELTRSFADSDGFRAVARGSSLQDVEDWFGHDGRHTAALVIPKNFTKDIEHERQSTVSLIVEGSNMMITSNSNIAAFEIIQHFNQETGKKLVARDLHQVPYLAERRMAPVDFNYRILGNPKLDYMRFFVYGLALIAMQQGLLLSVSSGILWKGNKPVPEEFALSRWKRWLVKTFVYWSLGMFSYAVFLGISNHFFMLPVNGNFTEHFMLAGSFLFCIIQLGGIVASLCKDELLFSRVSVCYTVPAFILSGFTWPLDPMPFWVRCLAYLSPYTYVADTARNLYIYGSDSRLAINCAVLFITGLVAFPIASKLYSKIIEKKKSK